MKNLFLFLCITTISCAKPQYAEADYDPMFVQEFTRDPLMDEKWVAKREARQVKETPTPKVYTKEDVRKATELLEKQKREDKARK